MDCLNCERKYVCCKNYGVTLSKDEVHSKKFKGNVQVVPLTENSKMLGYVIILNKKEDGSCIYHNGKTGLCNIYEYRPEACRKFSCIGRI